jgi:putative ABC transport system ATP-binding protein
MSVLVVDQLEKWWDENSGLRPISFQLDAGEFVVVRGRSGSGKSTLLALIIGWCAPDGGSISLLADDARPVEPSSWSTVAIVPQVLGLVPELTVRENIAEAFAGIDREEGSVDALLAALDIVEMAGRSPTDTSMGQQQRVAVARAVAGRPRLLLADEPTSHQDAGHVAAVVAALRSAADAGCAVLVATHDDSIIAAANRVIDLVAEGH